MKKIGIILFQNMRYAPFLKVYESILSSLSDVVFDVIYLDRDRSLNELRDEHHISVSWHGKGTLSAPKHERLYNFLIFRNDVIRILRENQYDKLIVLTTFPAVLLSSFLTKNYKSNFIIDIRDFTHENFSLYYQIEKKVLSNSSVKIISSPGFMNFLPKDDYVICHNIDLEAANNFRTSFEKAVNRRIIISYIGTISYKHLCKKMINLILNDDRFEFNFYGNEADGNDIGDYVKLLDCNRISWNGPFLPDEKRRIYLSSDLIFNCYGYDSDLVKYALSNKFYDSAIYKKPLLVSPNTAMSELSKEFAFQLDLDNVTDLNALFSWYQDLDSDSFVRHSDFVIDNSLSDNELMKKRIIEFILN